MHVSEVVTLQFPISRKDVLLRPVCPILVRLRMRRGAAHKADAMVWHDVQLALIVVMRPSLNPQKQVDYDG